MQNHAKINLPLTNLSITYIFHKCMVNKYFTFSNGHVL